MGCPVIGETALEIEAGDYFYTGTVISMGNPHLVIFVEDITNINLPVIGPLLECPSAVPEPDECRICPGAKYRRSTDEGLGTRFRHYASLWDRSLCDSVASAVRGKPDEKPKSSWMEALLPSIGMKFRTRLYDWRGGQSIRGGTGNINTTKNY